MKTEKIATLSGIRLKIAAAGLSIACLGVGVGAALPALSHAFAPGPVGATTTTTTTTTHPAPPVTTCSHSSRLIQTVQLSTIPRPLSSKGALQARLSTTWATGKATTRENNGNYDVSPDRSDHHHGYQADHPHHEGFRRGREAGNVRGRAQDGVHAVQPQDCIRKIGLRIPVRVPPLRYLAAGKPVVNNSYSNQAIEPHFNLPG